MANTRRFEIEVLGDTSNARRALADLESAGTKHLNSLANMAKAAVGAFALTEVAQGVKSLVAAAEESQRVTKITEQVIKSTGEAAGVTAKQVADLADAMSRKTGVDDEAIMSAQNVLLTFKNLHNTAGEGNQIFDRTSKAMLDLSTVFGGLDSSALQLGKALNDPVAGLGKLQKVGVNFTFEQRELVKSLVATGDVLGAQKVMLAEIESQVGGTAEASATASDKMRVAWGNLQEDLGEKLLPVVTELSDWFVDTAIPAIEDTVNWVEDELVPVFEEWGSWLADVWPDVVDAFNEGIDLLTSGIDGLVDVGQGVTEFFQGVWQGDLDEAWAAAQENFENAWNEWSDSGLKDVVMNLGLDFANGVLDWADPVHDAVFDMLRTVLIDMPAKVMNAAQDLGRKLAGELVKGMKDVLSAINPLNWFGGGGSNDVLTAQNALVGVGPMQGTTPSGGVAASGYSASLNQVKAAIAKLESGGSYTIRSKTSTASGKYQYLRGTWGNYGGYRDAADAPPAVQEEKASKDMGAYMKRYNGNVDLVALAWFQGPGVADKVAKNPALWNKTDANGMKASTYAAIVRKNMGKTGGSVGTGGRTTTTTRSTPKADTGPDLTWSGGSSSSDWNNELDTVIALQQAGYSTFQAADMWRNAMRATHGDEAKAARMIEAQLKAAQKAAKDGETTAKESTRTANTTDLEYLALKDLADAGATEAEAAEKWRQAMLDAGNDSRKAYHAIEAALGNVEKATRDTGDSMEQSVEDYAKAFFEGVKQLYQGRFDQAAFDRAMGDATKLGTTYRGPGSDITVDLYATDPATGGTLFDAAGNPIMASDTEGIARRLKELGYGGGNTPGPSYNGPGVPGVAGTSYVFNLNGVGADTANQLVDALRAKGMIRPDGSVVVTR